MIRKVIDMKKVLALLLSVVMVMALVACGGSPTTTNGGSASGESATGTDGGSSSSGGSGVSVTSPPDMKVAMVTDYGDITDQSFNQTTYEACKAWCDANGVSFTYFKPVSDSDEDRVSMIESAIDQGFNVIVMPGFAFAPAIQSTAGDYDDVKFIGIDIAEAYFSDGFTLPSNLYCAEYKEELCGYMAGYAAVKLGYTKLGYLGGMAVPAVVRYGYGFVQGVDAAAVEDGLSGVELKYAYGNQFYGDADITAAMDTWYGAGTEVVFACGGGIYSSAAEAAAKVGGKVIGVDTDQSGIIDGQYGAGMTLTSAMKGLAATVYTLLDEVKDGSFTGGKVDTLGLVSATDPESNYVQIPMDTTQWGDGFTKADYQQMVADMYSGKLTVSNDITASASDFATAITLTDQGNLK